MLTPLARWTDQALRLEAYGMWWRGSRWWISFYIPVGAFLMCLPILPLFSLDALQLLGPFSCGGYYTLQLLHTVYLVIALSTGVD